MEANHASGATDVDGAASRLSSLINSKQSGLPSEEIKEPTEEQSEAVETPEGDTPAEEPRYKVKIGDEERDVTIEELRKGYMMEADYRKKTSDVAERRKALEAKAQEIDSQLSEAKELLDLEFDNLNSPEMQQLKEYQPDEYLKAFEKVQKKAEKFQKLKAKREAEQQERQKELAKKEWEALMMAVPEWLDEGTREAESKEVFQALSKLGFSDNELANLADHRVFALARKALKFEKISTQDLESKKVRTPPKTQQPGTSKSFESRQTTETKSLRAQLKKSGNMRDAAALLRSFVK